jgi:hypothetical protein
MVAGFRGELSPGLENGEDGYAGFAPVSLKAARIAARDTSISLASARSGAVTPPAFASAGQNG